MENICVNVLAPMRFWKMGTDEKEGRMLGKIKKDSPTCFWWKGLWCEFFYSLLDINLAGPKGQKNSDDTGTQKVAERNVGSRPCSSLVEGTRTRASLLSRKHDLNQFFELIDHHC